MTGTDQLPPPGLRPSAPPTPPTPPTPARHRPRFGRRLLSAVRRAGVAVTAPIRGLRRWIRRPIGRFVLPGLGVMVLLAGGGAAGGFLVPASAPDARAAAQATAGVPDTAGTGLPGLDGLGIDPSGPAQIDPSAGGQPSAGDPPAATTQLTRPQDALGAWATGIAPKVDIPVTALKAYGYAQLRAQQTLPGCHLAWTTLAGIGKVESNHGRANGADLLPDGRSTPPIIGAALDGTNNTVKITDHDQGLYDHDTVYDHAVGPMQFIPTTWQKYQVDADEDGTADPNNINDAAMAAADYLCAGGRDLAVAGDWRAAILSYNALAAYAQDVFTAANDYGLRSQA